MMNIVTVNGKQFRIVEAATDDIETTMVNGNTIEYVSGIAKDENGDRYEIDWYIDCNTNKLPEDGGEWVNDWNNADEVHLIED